MTTDPAAPRPCAPTVDMSPAAIDRRLATVGALHRLMLSLLTAKPVPPTR